MRKILLAICWIAAPWSSAWAMSCDNPINSYDRTYCSALEMIQLDEGLNAQYQKTMQVLNDSQKATVKKAQIQWIRARDKDCSVEGSIAVGCVNRKMKKRIDVLQKIERECKAAGCAPAMLEQVEQ